MINCGRKLRKTSPEHCKIVTVPRSAKLTAVLGILVFTVFVCASADRSVKTDTATVFGEGAYQVFAETGGRAEPPKDAFNEEDGSFWTYLESVISKFIYGDR